MSAGPRAEDQAPKTSAKGRPESGRSGLRTMMRSFDYATQGVQEVFRTERHMRVHFVIALIIAAWSVAFRIPLLELLFVYSAIVLVIITEIVNTLVEGLVDLITEEWSARAKRIKDIAAGCVLVACVYAGAIFCIVFLSPNRLEELGAFWLGLVDWLRGDGSAAREHFERSMVVREMPVLYLGATGLVMLALMVVIFKERLAKGKFTSGGWMSGHATLAVYVATLLAFATHFHLWVSAGLAVLCILVIQSRVEGRIHTWGEVGRGALCGGALAAALYALGALVPPGAA